MRAMACSPASLVQNREHGIQRKNRGNLAPPPGTAPFSPENPAPPTRSNAPSPVIQPSDSLVVYAVASATSAVLMAWDKLRAVRGGRRVPERVLHAVEFAGGWPGAFLAMLAVHHKRAKPSFWLVSLTAALAHVALWWALGWLPWPSPL